MAARTAQGASKLAGFRMPNRFSVGLGVQLPEAYKKFWYEWRVQKPAPVHYIEKEGKYERNPETGEVKPIQNVPIPVSYPLEMNNGIWGGEGIVRGFQKRTAFKRRVPHFWVPVLKKTVVYSAILDQYFSVNVTERALNLIHENHGLDHYLLKTPACDLKSILTLTMKKSILEQLSNGCPNLSKNPTKQTDILNEYQHYLKNYTAEDIEWYGLTYQQALDKIEKIIKLQNPTVPHKILFRQKLIEQLREKTKDLESGLDSDDDRKATQDKSSWMNKINPFGKKD